MLAGKLDPDRPGLAVGPVGGLALAALAARATSARRGGPVGGRAGAAPTRHGPLTGWSVVRLWPLHRRGWWLPTATTRQLAVTVLERDGLAR
jgi:hypothetical protein